MPPSPPQLMESRAFVVNAATIGSGPRSKISSRHLFPTAGFNIDRRQECCACRHGDPDGWYFNIGRESQVRQGRQSAGTCEIHSYRHHSLVILAASTGRIRETRRKSQHRFCTAAPRFCSIRRQCQEHRSGRALRLIWPKRKLDWPDWRSRAGYARREASRGAPSLAPPDHVRQSSSLAKRSTARLRQALIAKTSYTSACAG